MKRGTLVEGFTPKGAVCCDDPAHSSAHVAELWDRDYSGRCSRGDHEKCAHAAGGPQEAGVTVISQLTNAEHVWHCGCDCHPHQRYKPRAGSLLAAVHDSRTAADEPAGGRVDVLELPSQLALFDVQEAP